MKKQLSTVLYLVLSSALICSLNLAPLTALALQPTPQTGFIGADPTPAGTIPWQLLLQAKTVQKPNKKFGPIFTEQIQQLDKKSVKLYGFMLPLETSDLQKRFLLGVYPPHCSFCLSGGPESLVEVIAATPLKYTLDAIIISGTMNVLENDLVYYRLTDAKLAQ
jgi:uncharacterized protein